MVANLTDFRTHIALVIAGVIVGVAGAEFPAEAAIALCIAGMAAGPVIRERIVGIRVGG